MLNKLLVLSLLALAVLAVFGEKKANSKVIITRLTSRNEIDSAAVFLAWCNYFSSVGFEFPKVITEQAVHETGWFTSEIFLTNHNYFGMKKNTRGFCAGECLGHAKYARPSDSIRDYLAYQKRMLALARKQGRPTKTDEDYYALLQDLPFWRGVGYAEDPNYIKKLREVGKRLEKL